jgi:hypothetical protein
MQEIMTNNVIKLESMKYMSIEQIVNMYKRGYIIENSSQIEGLPDSPESSERLRKYAFMDNVSDYPIPPGTYERWERQKRYGFTGNETIPPAIQERFERQRKYAFTGQGSESIQNLQGISFSDGALLLVGIGVLAYFYVKKY